MTPVEKRCCGACDNRECECYERWCAISDLCAKHCPNHEKKHRTKGEAIDAHMKSRNRNRLDIQEAKRKFGTGK